MPGNFTRADGAYRWVSPRFLLSGDGKKKKSLGSTTKATTLEAIAASAVAAFLKVADIPDILEQIKTKLERGSRWRRDDCVLPFLWDLVDGKFDDQDTVKNFPKPQGWEGTEAQKAVVQVIIDHGMKQAPFGQKSGQAVHGTADAVSGDNKVRVQSDNPSIKPARKPAVKPSEQVHVLEQMKRLRTVEQEHEKQKLCLL